MKTFLHKLTTNHSRYTLTFVTLMLTACASTESSNQRYDIGVGELSLPPNLNQLNPSQRFRLPNQVVNPIASIDNVGQTDLIVGDETAWIEKLSQFSSLSGSYRLVLRQAPNDLWQKLESFVKQKSKSDIVSQTNLGLIDSNWYNTSDSLDSSSSLQRYRLRLDSLAQRVEIYLAVQAIDGSGKFYTDTDESISQLRQLANRLFNESDSTNIKTIDLSDQSTTLATATPSLPATTTIEQLVHQESLSKTWKKVELALLRGAFTIEQKNEKDRYFSVRYIDPTTLQDNKDNKEVLKQIFSSDGYGVRLRIQLREDDKDVNNTVISIKDDKNQSTIPAQSVHTVLQNIRLFLQ